jgi:hypothetical protein
MLQARSVAADWPPCESLVAYKMPPSTHTYCCLAAFRCICATPAHPSNARIAERI